MNIAIIVLSIMSSLFSMGEAQAQSSDVPRYLTPDGQTEFCEKFFFTGLCIPGEVNQGTKISLATLHAVNTKYNRQIVEATDFDLFGRIESWDLGIIGQDGVIRGDCDAYALNKAYELSKVYNVSVSNLLLALVQVPEEEMPEATAQERDHMVLLVKHADGNYHILDNRYPDVAPDSELEARYKLLAIQSEVNPNIWELTPEFQVEIASLDS